MKKILLSVLTIGLVVAGVSGATAAWFRDVDKSEGHTIVAGTLNPEVRNVVLNVTNAEPGTIYSSDTVNFFNHTHNSTIPVKYRIYDELVSQSHWNYYNYLWIDAFYRKEMIGGVLVWTPYYSGWLKDLYIDPSICSYMGNVPSGSGHDWMFDIKLHETAGNWAQGQNAVFNLVFESTQVNNPGWTE